MVDIEVGFWLRVLYVDCCVVCCFFFLIGWVMIVLRVYSEWVMKFVCVLGEDEVSFGVGS